MAKKEKERKVNLDWVSEMKPGLKALIVLLGIAVVFAGSSAVGAIFPDILKVDAVVSVVAFILFIGIVIGFHGRQKRILNERPDKKSQHPVEQEEDD